MTASCTGARPVYQYVKRSTRQPGPASSSAFATRSSSDGASASVIQATASMPVMVGRRRARRNRRLVEWTLDREAKRVTRGEADVAHLRHRSKDRRAGATYRRCVPMPEPVSATADVQVEMVNAVLAGGGLQAIAAIASRHAGAPVVLSVPALGTPDAPDDGSVVAEAPIVSAGETVGAVLLLGEGRPEAAEYLRMAAIAA